MIWVSEVTQELRDKMHRGLDMEQWERREKKLQSKRSKMRQHGRSIVRIIKAVYSDKKKQQG